jgi:hypothetical protein
MTIYREPTKDARADYAEAQRVRKSAREIAEWDAAFADAKAHPAPLAQPQEDDRVVTFRSYGAARDALVSALLEDALAHDAGHFDEIGRRAAHVVLPDGDEPALTNLRVALSFSATWLDAMTSDPQSSEGVTKAEWPILARQIASDLSADREISDSRAIAHPDAPSSTAERARSDVPVTP